MELFFANRAPGHAYVIGRSFEKCFGCHVANTATDRPRTALLSALGAVVSAMVAGFCLME
jgi:hypothetical protein